MHALNLFLLIALPLSLTVSSLSLSLSMSPSYSQLIQYYKIWSEVQDFIDSSRKLCQKCHYVGIANDPYSHCFKYLQPFYTHFLNVVL